MTELKTGGGQGYLRIATEEAFITKEVLTAYKHLIAEGFDDPGFVSLWGFYSGSPSARATTVIERLQDMGARRLGDMDAAGIQTAVLTAAIWGEWMTLKAGSVIVVPERTKGPINARASLRTFGLHPNGAIGVCPDAT